MGGSALLVAIAALLGGALLMPTPEVPQQPDESGFVLLYLNDRFTSARMEVDATVSPARPGDNGLAARPRQRIALFLEPPLGVAQPLSEVRWTVVMAGAAEFDPERTDCLDQAGHATCEVATVDVAHNNEMLYNLPPVHGSAVTGSSGVDVNGQFAAFTVESIQSWSTAKGSQAVIQLPHYGRGGRGSLPYSPPTMTGLREMVQFWEVPYQATIRLAVVGSREYRVETTDPAVGSTAEWTGLALSPSVALVHRPTADAEQRNVLWAGVLFGVGGAGVLTLVHQLALLAARRGSH